MKRLCSAIAGIERVDLARVVALAKIGRQGSVRSEKGPSKDQPSVSISVIGVVFGSRSRM